MGSRLVSLYIKLIALNMQRTISISYDDYNVFTLTWVPNINYLHDLKIYQNFIIAFL